MDAPDIELETAKRPEPDTYGYRMLSDAVHGAGKLCPACGEWPYCRGCPIEKFGDVGHSACDSGKPPTHGEILALCAFCPHSRVYVADGLGISVLRPHERAHCAGCPAFLADDGLQAPPPAQAYAAYRSAARRVSGKTEKGAGRRKARRPIG